MLELELFTLMHFANFLFAAASFVNGLMLLVEVMLHVEIPLQYFEIIFLVTFGNMNNLENNVDFFRIFLFVFSKSFAYIDCKM